MKCSVFSVRCSVFRIEGSGFRVQDCVLGSQWAVVAPAPEGRRNIAQAERSEPWVDGSRDRKDVRSYNAFFEKTAVFSVLSVVSLS